MGSITTALTGKTVRQVLTDDRHLLVRCEDGTEAVIEWTCDGPALKALNVRIVVDLPPLTADGGM